MWIYAAHAVGGGIASAITPSKITNAAATIGVGGKEEAQFIKAVLVPALIMCAITGAMLMQLFIYKIVFIVNPLILNHAIFYCLDSLNFCKN